MGDMYTNPPQSRNEAILRATIDGTEYTAPPQSRIEDLLIELKEAIEQGGCSVESYEQLTNKPQINGTTLSGDKSTEDLIPIDKGLEFDSDGKLAVSLGDGLAFNSDGEIDNLTEANPSDSATGELSKLKVGSDIYSVVTKAVNDLTNYYTKSEVYTKDEVNNIAQARFAVVAELPTQDIQTNVIYLVPKSTAQTNNDYDEYIYALKSTNPDTYGWEKIGDTEIDLSDYVTTQALNTALADYTTTTDLTTLLTGKADESDLDALETVVNGKADENEATPVSVSGNPITITDAANIPCESLSMTIEPIQAGSGTPSPTNVRPISGLTEARIYTGKNLWDGTLDTKQYFPFILKAGTKITFSCSIASGNLAISVFQQGSDQRYDFYTLNNYTSRTIELSSDTESFMFYGTSLPTNGQLEISDEATPYTPYNGVNSATITFGETVYGGYVDFESGKVVCTWKYVDLKSVDFSGLSGGGLGWHDFFDGSYNALSNKLNSNSGGWNSTIPCLTGSSTKMRVYGSTALFTTGDYADSDICYELTTPIEIQLTPAQLTLLKGYNTVSANGATINLDYQKNNLAGDIKKWVIEHFG